VHSAFYVFTLARLKEDDAGELTTLLQRMQREWMNGRQMKMEIRSRVIAEAKRRAMRSDQNMKQIAFSLGFVSEAHFSKYFKNYTGVSFSELKRNCFHLAQNIHSNT
jgi:AraC-like DNA-binding protein